MNKKIIISVSLYVLISFPLIFIIGCAKSKIGDKEAKTILNDFYFDNVPESINDRHLLNAGKAIVPHLIIEIQNKNMPKRGYAILALGKIGDKEAIPILAKILEDRSELIYFRTDSLRAIWHIDQKLGEEYARTYQTENNEINRTIELLREGKI
jgi:HEAT repeat protein